MRRMVSYWLYIAVLLSTISATLISSDHNETIEGGKTVLLTKTPEQVQTERETETDALRNKRQDSVRFKDSWQVILITNLITLSIVLLTLYLTRFHANRDKRYGISKLVLFDILTQLNNFGMLKDIFHVEENDVDFYKALQYSIPHKLFDKTIYNTIAQELHTLPGEVFYTVMLFYYSLGVLNQKICIQNSFGELFEILKHETSVGCITKEYREMFIELKDIIREVITLGYTAIATIDEKIMKNKKEAKYWKEKAMQKTFSDKKEAEKREKQGVFTERKFK
ncbi:hypothetical protein KAX02_04445 [candidate division WOR-3 bacterium]|nr:hypothetical protein [candidate division WOR-3 bacterium]